jgi:hypothetical protein
MPTRNRTTATTATGTARRTRFFLCSLACYLSTSNFQRSSYTASKEGRSVLRESMLIAPVSSSKYDLTR